MDDILRYKDFLGSVHFSADDNIFYGKVIGVDDLITFEGRSVEELKASFEDAVNDYLELCEQTGKQSYKSCKGTFNVRLTPEIHRLALMLSFQKGMSLNNFVKTAIVHEVQNVSGAPLTVSH